MKKKVAIKVSGVSKKFKVPHRKIDSLRNAFINVFAPNEYKEFDALKNISFEVNKGEFLGIIGRNGAGKSTLLKVLAGIYRADSGEININGRISPFLELGIGFNPDLSGRDNVYLNATVLGVSKNEIDEKFDEIVKFAELEKFIDQQLKNYSSGMKARLAFSVSIHANREILLMDEVLAVGDTNFQKKCLDIFRGYKDQGKTVILVTHSMNTVREYCDRALLFHQGKLIESGGVEEVCDEYIMKNLISDEVGSNGATYVRRVAKKKQSVISAAPSNISGERIGSISRGQDFFVEIDVELKSVPKNMFITVQIYDRDKDFFVSGNNAEIDGYEHEWMVGKNIVRIKFEDNNLNYGCVYFRAVLFCKNEMENVILDHYSSKDEDIYLKVDKRSSGGGLMYMKHKWGNFK